MRADNSRDRTLAVRLRRREVFRAAPAFLVFLATFCAFLSSAWAGTFADFTPQPASPGTPEVIWNQGQLYAGRGAGPHY